MAKKLVSLILMLAMCISLCTPVFAVDNLVISNSPNSVSFATSNTCHIEIEINPQSNTKSVNNEILSFKITQYEYEEIVQTVSGKPNGSILVVTDYQDGIAVEESVINLSDRVSQSKTTSSGDAALRSAPAGSPLGYISYNTDTLTGENLRIRVYSLLTKQDTESYTIRGAPTDTLAVIIGIVASIVSGFIRQTETWTKIAVAIVSAAGGSVAGGVIGVFFSEAVAVNASYYDLTGYDYTLDRSTRVQSGVARYVLTKESGAYHEWFYDWYTPYNWKDNTLAYWFWTDLNGGDHYPGVKSYS